MACTARVFGVPLPHHWQRCFTGTDTGDFREVDMWGRSVTGEHVVCHTHMVCSRCGAVGDPVECICDKTKADHCAFRLDGMIREAAVIGDPNGTSPPPPDRTA